MNSATKNLEDDHVSILKLIDVMEMMTRKTDPKIDDLEEAVDLIKNFADGLHHAKEESLLFPLLGEHGFSSEFGPVAAMLSDHAQGRNYVKEITENIRLLKLGELSSMNLVYRNMLWYGQLLRNHIAKENNVLFRMADDVLSAVDQQSLLKQFEKIENEGVHNHQKKDFIARIGKLAQLYDLK